MPSWVGKGSGRRLTKTPYQLQRFQRSGDEADFSAFESYLRVQEGDVQARMELLKPAPDLNRIRQGFLQGRIRFGRCPAHDRPDPAVQLDPLHLPSDLIWAQADDLIVELRRIGGELQAAVRAGDEAAAGSLLLKLRELNEKLTEVEDQFPSFSAKAPAGWSDCYSLSSRSRCCSLRAWVSP